MRPCAGSAKREEVVAMSKLDITFVRDGMAPRDEAVSRLGGFGPQSRSSMTDTPLTDDELNRFNDFLYRKTGIRMDEKKRYFSERRILERIRITRSAGFAGYFQFLHCQESGEELQQIVNLMTVNETYFFREHYQFDCMVNDLLNDVARRKRKGQRIRIWSVPCSTGEEPYSIAIFLLEKWLHVDDYEIEILASDIDTSVLSKARAGIYDERALHALPASYRRKYFSRVGDAQWQIVEDLRTSIDFSIVNVTNAQQFWRGGDVDLVFCRNLLIYFDDVSRRQVADMFFEAMAPGGFICLGHSESMSRMSSLFTPRKFNDALVYQKPFGPR
jgi:chemotaxis protein methyltransferase CheR